MITEDQIKLIPNSRVLPRDSSEKFGFCVQTSISDETGFGEVGIEIEIRCPVIKSKLYLSRAEIFRPGGGEIPPAWVPENLETMLQGMIDLGVSMKNNESKLAQSLGEKKTTLEVSTAVYDAACVFLRDKDPLLSVSDFITICTQAYLKAVKNQNE